jgi:hypothetical protein
LDNIIAEQPIELQEIKQRLNTKPESRMALAQDLNERRTNSCLPDKAFPIVAELVSITLNKSHECADSNVGRLLLNMSQTFYRIKDNEREYLQGYLCHDPLWQDMRFWEGAFFDALSYERRRAQYPKRKKWKYMDSHQREDAQLQHESMVFGMLGTFALNMINMGVTFVDCRNFILKMCMINTLKEEYSEMLLNNIDEQEREAAAKQLSERELQERTKPIHPSLVRDEVNALNLLQLQSKLQGWNESGNDSPIIRDYFDNDN